PVDSGVWPYIRTMLWPGWKPRPLATTALPGTTGLPRSPDEKLTWPPSRRSGAENRAWAEASVGTATAEAARSAPRAAPRRDLLRVVMISVSPDQKRVVRPMKKRRPGE